VSTFVTGPMRDFMLVASADYLTSTMVVEDTLVTSYYLPEDAEGGQQALGYAADALELFSELFGPYPYAEFDLVETPTTAGGIEYPGLVVIARQLYNQTTGFFEFATVHETAHQWWYGLVGNDQVDEPWLDEALAQYSTTLYYERLKGPDAADAIRELYFERQYARIVEEGRDQPVGKPVRAYASDDYGPIVYGKGPLFFQALRDQVGDQLFLEILRTYLKRYEYGIATPGGFLATAEQVSGRELGGLYTEWIVGEAP
jgi:aminopeptidase N